MSKGYHHYSVLYNLCQHLLYQNKSSYWHCCQRSFPRHVLNRSFTKSSIFHTNKVKWTSLLKASLGNTKWFFYCKTSLQIHFGTIVFKSVAVQERHNKHYSVPPFLYQILLCCFLKLNVPVLFRFSFDPDQVKACSLLEKTGHRSMCQIKHFPTYGE